MKIEKIFENISILERKGAFDGDVVSVYSDSRDAVRGGLFVAVSGIRVDGHDYIDQALASGTQVVVCEHFPENIDPSSLYIRVKDTEHELSKIAGNFYDNPSRKMNIIAVTGTNGKTTIAQMLYRTLLFLGQKAAVFSTAGDYINEDKIEIDRRAVSSLEPVLMQKYLSLAEEAGCQYVCIEATSHALDQQRYSGLNISRAIFTNLTQDHLDYHKTLDNYKKSKKRLFDDLGADAVSLINVDDDSGLYMTQDTNSTVLGYGQKKSNYTISNTFYEKGKSFFDVNDVQVSAPIVGLFNIYNATAVYGALDSFGYSQKDIIAALQDLGSGPGRMQYIENNKDINAIVDYAHTPDALAQVLGTLADITTNGRVITVVGCGGERDSGKRPLMAQIAQNASEKVFFTADNPRGESLSNIFDDMRKGLDLGIMNYDFVFSRDEAIKAAIDWSKPGDTILVAGKGHEKYQEIKGQKIPFDDAKTLCLYL